MASIEVPDNDLRCLSTNQINLRRIRAFVNSLGQMSEIDCAKLLTNDATITEEALRLVSVLTGIDKPNASNPTRVQLLELVARRVHANKPLEMFASLCLEKGDGVRDGKLNWFLNKKGSYSPNAREIGVYKRMGESEAGA
jgi:hypothetical protein